MPVSRREMRSRRAFAAPLLGIAVLLGFYWLLADWQQVPKLIGSVFSAVHLIKPW
jgi:ABC-type nitrate/sulfonate/bicarbonate transport system permease component